MTFTDYEVTTTLLNFEDNGFYEQNNQIGLDIIFRVRQDHAQLFEICESHGVPRLWITKVLHKWQYHPSDIDNRILRPAALRLYNTSHPLSVPQDLIYREVGGELIVSWWWGASKALGLVAGPFSLAAFGLQRLLEDRQTHVMVFSKQGTYLRNYE